MAISNNLQYTILLFIISVLLSIQVLAREFSIVTGVVYYSEEPLPGVEIIVKESGGGVITDLKGRFKISGLVPGTYTLEFHLIGYKDHKEIVILHSGQTVNLKIQMMLTVLEFSPISVYGNKYYETLKKKESSLRIISPELINRIPTIGETDIFRTLQTQPEVNTVSEFSNHLFVRGGTPDQNLILINGAPIYQPYHLFGIATAMNIDAIESVEFYTGAFSSRYGDHLSAVLDITSAPGTETFSGIASLNLINSKVSLAGPLGKQIRWRLSGRRTFYDLLAKLANIEIPYYFYDLQGKVSLLTKNKGLWTFNFFSSLDNFDRYNKRDEYLGDEYLPPEECHVDSNYYYLLMDYNIAWRNNLLSTNFLKRLSGSSIIKGNLYYSSLVQDLDYTHKWYAGDKACKEVLNHVKWDNENTEYYPECGKSNAENNYWEVGTNLNYDLILNGESSLNAGFDYKRKCLYYDWEISTYGEFSDYSTIFVDFAPDTFHYDKTLDLYSLYAEYAWQLSNAVNLRFGLRIPYLSEYSRITPEPRFTVNYAPDEKWQLKISWGKHSQTLFTSTEYGFYSLAEILIFAQNKPEKSDHYIIEMNYKTSSNTESRLAFYYKDYENLNTVVPDTVFRLVSGKAYSRGMEFSLENFELLGFNTSLFFSWSKTRKSVLGESYYPNYDQRYKGTLIVNKKLSSKWSADLSWSVSAGRYANLYDSPVYINFHAQACDNRYRFLLPKNYFRYPVFHRMDLKISRAFHNKLGKGNLYLQIINIYNRMNVVYYTGLIDKYNRKEQKYEYNVKYLQGFPILPTVGMELKF